MKKPYEVEVGGSRGAPMGRRNLLPANPQVKAKLHLRRVPMVDYCYDPGGAYWGCPKGKPLFCAWGEDPDTDWYIEIFFRVPGGDRNDAKAIVRKTMPNARFYR